MTAPLRIWRISDGRRGHDNQSLGLIEALGRIRPVAVEEITVSGGLDGARRAMGSRLPSAAAQLVIGAGHATHLALLIAARRARAFGVVLMKPSLPRSFFHLCIVPQHDGLEEGRNVITSLGALNRVRPGNRREAGQSLILVGGPSRHHAWDEALLERQINELTTAASGQSWQVATSPRTPASTTQRLGALPRIELVPFAQTSPQWLPGRLASAAQVWVTQDSVSMAYESVSGGAATGLLAVPMKHASPRARAAVTILLESGYAFAMEHWRETGRLPAPPAPLQEAERCAQALLARWPQLA